MKENFLHLLSETPCILNVNGKKIGEIDNNTCMEVDIITKTNHLYLTYEPITMKVQALPYTTLINTSNTPTTNNEHIKIIPFPNNHYDIILSPFYHYDIVDSKTLFNGSVGKYFISIVSDSVTKLIIYSGLTIVFSTTLPSFNAVKVEENKNVITIEGVIDDATYYVLAVNTSDFSILYSDIVHSIENNKDNIILFKSLNTLCRHAEVCNINFNTITKDKYYVFEDDDNTIDLNPLLIPFAFLECVKIMDEKSAKSFLSSNYNDVNINSLKQYFGEINNIYLNRHESNMHKVNYTIHSTTYKNFNFFIDKNKIYDIEEIF